MFRQVAAVLYCCLLSAMQVHCFINGWSQATNLLLAGSKTYLSYSDSIAAGANHAMSECKHQFKWDRWNCPDNSLSLFTELNPTREMSFIHAINTAGIMFTLTKNCSLGDFTKCGCDNSKVGQMGGDDWQWGGCSDNVNFGERLSKNFIDELETGDDARAVANLHNNEVGRKVVRKNMQRRCKCHGVSGSCSVQTCWDQLADFRVIGSILKKKYLDAVRVNYVRGQLINGKVASRTVEGENSEDSTLLKKTNLVYLEKSPDYCDANSTIGTRGTEGRECLRSPKDDASVDELASWEHHSCKRLCTKCGLRVTRTKIVVESRCNCQFQWCCNVRCDTCKSEKTVYACEIL
ncbi:protein Wnt-8b-like [Amphiura filiformis]|uniref:protein Wnt-8b-like n=1 Tax=Amphiura filiformis TaxID=82378 RepID=UPI003B20D52A